MKKKLVAVIAVILVMLSAVLFFLLRDKENDIKFRTDKVVRGDIVKAVMATGTVNAVTTVLVGTQVSGTIKQIHVDYNSPVKQGQLIAQIDPSAFEAQVQQAKANLLSAEANLQRAEANLADAKRTMERNRTLFEKNLIARSDLDSSETRYEAEKAQVKASGGQIAQADASLKLAETNLKYTRIISPVDGVVISRNVDVGQTVAASFQTPTLFTIAQDLTKMQINTNVDEADIGRVRKGQEVEFTVDAYPDVTFRGEVWQVRNAPITVQNVVTYDAVIKVDNPDLLLKPGLTANVSIIISTSRDVLKIPNAALRFRPPDKGKEAAGKKGEAVWIAEKGSPRRISITTGISDGNHTELASGELKEGQEVIVESITKTIDRRPPSPRMF